jgi:hypothetical protein
MHDECVTYNTHYCVSAAGMGIGQLAVWGATCLRGAIQCHHYSFILHIYFQSMYHRRLLVCLVYVLQNHVNKAELIILGYDTGSVTPSLPTIHGWPLPY